MINEILPVKGFEDEPQYYFEIDLILANVPNLCIIAHNKEEILNSIKIRKISNEERCKLLSEGKLKMAVI